MYGGNLLLARSALHRRDMAVKNVVSGIQRTADKDPVPASLTVGSQLSTGDVPDLGSAPGFSESVSDIEIALRIGVQGTVPVRTVQDRSSHGCFALR